jgi:hypothetical protein
MCTPSLSSTHTCELVRQICSLGTLTRNQLAAVYLIYTHSIYFKMNVIDVTHLILSFNNGSLGSRIDEERSEMR